MLRDCRLVLTDRIVERGWLEVDRGLISAVGGGVPPSERMEVGVADDKTVVVTEGRTIVPGFVDVHVHGGGGVSFEAGERGAIEDVVRLHRSHGTTTQLASIASRQPEAMLASASLLGSLATEGLLAGIHLEGPFLSDIRRGAHDPKALRTPDLVLLRELVSAGQGSVRMVTVAPELAGGIELVEAIVAAGSIAAIGHTDASYSLAVDAINAGARVATHIFNGMRPMQHRDPGVALAALQDDRVVVEVINDGHHLADPVIGMAQRLAGSQRTAFVTDAMAAAGVGDGVYRLGDAQVRVVNGKAMLLDGASLAGSSLTMDRALRRAVRTLGFSLVDAVRATSTVPARLLGFERERGTIAAGMRADLVVLDEKLEVVAVMAAGRWVHVAGSESTQALPRSATEDGEG